MGRGLRIRKETGLLLAFVLLAWVGTALFGVPNTLRSVEAGQATTWWVNADGQNAEDCYARAFPIAPLLVLVFEGCYEDLDPGEMGSGYTSAHLHLWFLVGQSRTTTLWQTHDTLLEPHDLAVSGR